MKLTGKVVFAGGEGEELFIAVDAASGRAYAALYASPEEVSSLTAEEAALNGEAANAPGLGSEEVWVWIDATKADGPPDFISQASRAQMAITGPLTVKEAAAFALDKAKNQHL